MSLQDLDTPKGHRRALSKVVGDGTSGEHPLLDRSTTVSTTAWSRGRTSQPLSNCHIWPHGWISTRLPQLLLVIGLRRSLPFPSQGLNKSSQQEHHSQSHLLHYSIDLLTLCPCFEVVYQRQTLKNRTEVGQRTQTQLWAVLVPHLSTICGFPWGKTNTTS